jgi:hypothetical protein
VVNFPIKVLSVIAFFVMLSAVKHLFPQSQVYFQAPDAAKRFFAALKTTNEKLLILFINKTTYQREFSFARRFM